MKLIIDIDEKEYIEICEEPCTKLGLAIANGTPLEAQTTDETKEAYLKGYDYGVKDWFKSKTQPSEDCVSRDDVDAYIAKLMSGYLYDEERTRLEEFSAYLWELPSVTPERPKGKWVYKMQVMNNPYTYKCSVCKGWEKDKTKYCPNCGAEMEGGEDDDR